MMPPAAGPERHPGDEPLFHAFGTCLTRLLPDGTERLGVALSGGLDSTVLAHALKRWLLLCHPLVRLHAINVNHNLRPENELHAEEASLLGNCIAWGLPLSILVIPRGEVERQACAGHLGIEESARALRYRALKGEIGRLGLAAVCLAHQADDDLELQIMRFFQGQGEGRSIPGSRDAYVRPLLAFSRAALVEYARVWAIAWHEDSSNLHGRYLRNRIRRELVPLAGGIFPGYRQALVRQRQQSAEDEACLEALAAGLPWTEDPLKAGLTADWHGFSALDPALRWRAVRRACLMLLRTGAIARMPGQSFYRLFPGGDQLAVGDWHATRGGMQLGREGARAFVRPHIVVSRKKGYLLELTAPGRFELPDLGTVSLVAAAPGARGMRLPLVIRTLRHGDVSPDDGRSLWQKLRKRGYSPHVLADMMVLACRGTVAAVWCGGLAVEDLGFKDGPSPADCGDDQPGYRLEFNDLEQHP